MLRARSRRNLIEVRSHIRTPPGADFCARKAGLIVAIGATVVPHRGAPPPKTGGSENA
jgi:hypothetical protein